MSSLPRRPHGAKHRLPHPEHDADGHRIPSEVGELLRLWVGSKLAEVDAIVDQARAKLDAIPDRAPLMTLIGELVVRVVALEQELAELRKAAHEHVR